MSSAVFNDNDHCVQSGWATYQRRKVVWRCKRGHTLPPEPEPSNGIAPACYATCPKCGAPLKWFVCGQHRYGGIFAGEQP